jgi:hypothetical protein
LNPYSPCSKQDFKSCASTNSATRAPYFAGGKLSGK